jgi:hypothetical protein
MKTKNEFAKDISIPADNDKREKPEIRLQEDPGEEHHDSGQSVSSMMSIVTGADQNRNHRGKSVGKNKLTNHINFTNFQNAIPKRDGLDQFQASSI